MMIVERSEPLKACVHATLGILAGVCFAYNLAVWRRQRHEAPWPVRANLLIYAWVMAWESLVVRHHLRVRDG